MITNSLHGCCISFRSQDTFVAGINTGRVKKKTDFYRNGNYLQKLKECLVNKESKGRKRKHGFLLKATMIS